MAWKSGYLFGRHNQRLQAMVIDASPSHIIDTNHIANFVGGKDKSIATYMRTRDDFNSVSHSKDMCFWTIVIRTISEMAIVRSTWNEFAILLCDPFATDVIKFHTVAMIIHLPHDAFMSSILTVCDLDTIPLFDGRGHVSESGLGRRLMRSGMVGYPIL
jgi:hypothetical protein